VGLRLNIPLPGPFTWSQKISGPLGGKGCITFFLWLFVFPLVLCYALVWMTAVMTAYVIVGVWRAVAWVTTQIASRRT
jgi:hypothetical protein